MTKENNIRAVLETHFSGFKEELIDSAVNRLMEITEKVQHGKWIDMGDFEQCSECHGTRLKEFQTYYGKVVWIKTPYCPNCGTKMDEVEE